MKKILYYINEWIGYVSFNFIALDIPQFLIILIGVYILISGILNLKNKNINIKPIFLGSILGLSGFIMTSYFGKTLNNSSLIFIKELMPISSFLLIYLGKNYSDIPGSKFITYYGYFLIVLYTYSVSNIIYFSVFPQAHPY